jgi:hypothetical protein
MRIIDGKVGVQTVDEVEQDLLACAMEAVNVEKSIYLRIEVTRALLARVTAVPFLEDQVEKHPKAREAYAALKALPIPQFGFANPEHILQTVRESVSLYFQKQLVFWEGERIEAWGRLDEFRELRRSNEQEENE